MTLAAGKLGTELAEEDDVEFLRKKEVMDWDCFLIAANRLRCFALCGDLLSHLTSY